MAATIRYYDLDSDNQSLISLFTDGQVSDLSDVSDNTFSAQFLLENYITPNFVSFDGNGIDLKEKNKKVIVLLRFLLGSTV